MKKLLLILNPAAGQRKALGLLPQIVEAFAAGGYQTQVMFTIARGDATQYAREYAEQYHAVVCCGGDGTLNETLRGLLGLENVPLLGYIPAGTTNDFAGSLRLPADPVAAAKKIAEGEPRELDVGLFGDRCFSYIASFGAFTESSYSTPQSMKNLLGHLAYLLEGIKDISNIRPRRMHIETETRVYDDEYIFGAFSNSTSIGGLVKLEEEQVDMADGLLELLLVKMPRNLQELNRILASIASREYDPELIIFDRTAKALVKADGETPWSLDGEYEPGGGIVEIRNLHRVVTILQ